MPAYLVMSTCFIARYGGEEFVFVLPSTDLAGGKRVAEHIRKCIIKLDIQHDCSKIFPHLTISLGVTEYNARDSLSIDDILRRADECLYTAKANGRNTVVLSA